MENQMENQPLAQTATTFTALQENWFRPFGFNLRLLTNSEAVLAAAHTSFGRFGPAPSKHPPDFIFRFFEQRVDSGQLTFPDFRMAGSLAYQTMGEDARLVVNQETGLAEGYFSPTVLANEPFFRCHFLELAFFAMLAPRGMMGVHGAALVRHGRAVLLRAQSGGGKTTLAYAAARSKFQALAEDVVWLDIKNNLWRGAPWTFHLLPDAKNLFPELASYQPILQTNGEMKLEVDLETIRPGSTTTSAKPGPVILVERIAGGRSRLEPLDLAEAKPLWLAGFAGTEMDFPGYHHHIDALLTANAYRLYFGDDIEASVNLLETLFE
ncbi:MAG: hypothetical protein GWO38_34280 [Phycisphaerae bacterium]|nr:hypothetical protein [Phycisphaerae bacterium]NIX32557.1 hypothetical protein [Phycisphaerae bacterium]